MTATDNVPYHMRDDSDVEDADEAAATGATGDTKQQDGASTKTSSSSSTKGRNTQKDVDEIAGGLKQLFSAVRGEGKKPRLGTVEVDPNIDYADWTKDGPTLTSRAKMESDGMINIWVDLKKALPDLPKDYARPVKEWGVDLEGAKDCPPMNIVIFIVGSRGDVQPYLSLALRLIISNAHRIRIATHPDFKDFVLSANKRLKGKTTRGIDLEGRLEYYDVGGDPKELMAYMVKNPGLLPAWETIKSGEIGKKRKMTQELLQGFYHSTFEPDGPTGKAFAADAIISNPPAFAHVHVAEALGLPLLMSFTMPWTSTTAFKHPLVNIASSNAQVGLTNYFSYGMAEMLQWQGLGDVINHFRTATLGIEPLISRHGAGAVERLKVPWTYCWSEGLIEKPEDWKEHIDISGFYFYEADSDFEPDADLATFLKNGEAPIYVGFGSVVVEDAAAMTKTIFEAVEKAGTRALVSAGWGGLGGTDIPESVFILKGNIPHDWLFADGRVSAVCHHGGAGTTAIGLRNGLPTIVVPFFGDQKFWGDMIHRARAGPAPIPQKQLTPDNLAEGIKYALSPEARTAAGKMGEQIRKEKGEEKGVDSFHRHLPLKNMRCEVDPTKIAVWYSESLYLRLSAEVAGVLAAEGKVDLRKLKPLRAREYATRGPARDPISGGSLAVMHLVQNHYSSVAQIFYDPPKGVLNTMFSVPQGLLDLVIAMYEGFDGVTRAMGSEIRQKGPVEDFGSGVREGGKGLVYGWWDGITGLVTEPIAGGKKEGALGVIKGMGRSYVNVTARPAAGILGVMALPISGAWKSIRKAVGGAPTKELANARRGLSEDLSTKMSGEGRKEILGRFAELEKGTQERKERLTKKAKLFMTGEEDKFEEEMGIAAAEDKGKGKGVAEETSTTEGKEKPVEKSNSEMMRGNIIHSVQAQIAAEPEKGDELEAAEKRGYERALEEFKRQQAAEKGGEGAK